MTCTMNNCQWWRPDWGRCPPGVIVGLTGKPEEPGRGATCASYIKRKTKVYQELVFDLEGDGDGP